VLALTRYAYAGVPCWLLLNVRYVAFTPRDSHTVADLRCWIGSGSRYIYSGWFCDTVPYFPTVLVPIPVTLPVTHFTVCPHCGCYRGYYVPPERSYVCTHPPHFTLVIAATPSTLLEHYLDWHTCTHTPSTLQRRLPFTDLPRIHAPLHAHTTPFLWIGPVTRAGAVLHSSG